MSNYIFENAGQPTGQRFTSLETLYDPWTIRHLLASAQVGSAGKLALVADRLPGGLPSAVARRAMSWSPISIHAISRRPLGLPTLISRSSATTWAVIPCRHSPLI